MRRTTGIHRPLLRPGHHQRPGRQRRRLRRRDIAPKALFERDLHTVIIATHNTKKEILAVAERVADAHQRPVLRSRWVGVEPEPECQGKRRPEQAVHRPGHRAFGPQPVRPGKDCRPLDVPRRTRGRSASLDQGQSLKAADVVQARAARLVEIPAVDEPIPDRHVASFTSVAAPD